LIYFEEFDRIGEAFYREKQIQGWSRAKKMALMERNFDELHKLAACANNSHSSRYEFEKAIKAKIEASQ
jgi:putative endonuclease